MTIWEFEPSDKRAAKEKKEAYTPPEYLTRSALDTVPAPREQTPEMTDMDSREIIQAMLESSKKDLYRIFAMRIEELIYLDIEFPWEQRPIKRTKLSDKKKVDGTWVIDIQGNLKEDITYALLTAHLADIWFDAHAHAESEKLKTGFHFWVVYKLAKQRGYINVAFASTQQDKEQFDRVRKIEEQVGEYGVFYTVVNGFFPNYEAMEAEQRQKQKQHQEAKAAIEAMTGKVPNKPKQQTKGKEKTGMFFSNERREIPSKLTIELPGKGRYTDFDDDDEE